MFCTSCSRARRPSRRNKSKSHRIAHLTFVGRLEMINEQIKNGLYNRSRPEYYKLSEQAKDLIQGLLEVEADKRLTVDQALKH